MFDKYTRIFEGWDETAPLVNDFAVPSFAVLESNVCFLYPVITAVYFKRDQTPPESENDAETLPTLPIVAITSLTTWCAMKSEPPTLNKPKS